MAQQLHPVIVGANHRTADAALREKLYVEEDSRADFLLGLKEQGLAEVLLVSTCDRVEVVTLHTDPERASQIIQRALAARLGMTPGKATDYLHRLYDDEAVRHFFAISCALESQMIGEAQILGQVKDAVTLSQGQGLLGGPLEGWIRETLTLAKRVRTQTQIGEGAISVATAAVRVARDLHGDLSGCSGLIYGLGEVGQILLEQFRLSGLSQWVLTGSSRRTARVAARLGCHFAPIDELPDRLALSDVVITAQGAGRFLIDQPLMAQAVAARRRKPVLLLDCGVPADVDPAVDSLDDAYRYALEDVEALAEKGQTGREAAAAEARAMVDEAVGEYRRHRAEKDGVPGLVALRQHFELVRESVLKDHPGIDANEATRLLVNRLLHRPSEALRQVAADGGAADIKDLITVNRVLEQLFGVSEDLSQPGRKETEE